MILCLSLAADGRPPSTFLYTRSEICIGRSSKNDIVLDPMHNTVSRQHAVIRREGSTGWTIEDLDSSHGTYVNELRIRERKSLHSRDLITLGGGGPTLRVLFEGADSKEESIGLIRQPLPGQFPLALYKDFPRIFQVYEKIGEGGYGQVWRGRPRGKLEWRAIKFLRPELLAPSDVQGRRESIERLVHRFRREAHLMKRLQERGTEGVVRVHEVGGDPGEGFLYMILDYIDGESLDKPLSRRELLEEKIVAEILLQLARTLDDAHSIHWEDVDSGREMRGIVHRDVKPSNIIIREDDGRAFLCDFGIAAVEQGGERLTAPQMRVSAFKYTAPEVLSQNNVSPATDLWGLAVTGYVLLSGNVFPYGGMGLADTLKAIHQKKMMPLTKYRPTIDKGLARFLESALDPDPRERPQSAREWVETLKKLSYDV